MPATATAPDSTVSVSQVQPASPPRTESPAYLPPEPTAAPAAPAATSFEFFYRFDWRRLSNGDRITFASTLVVILSLFLPWFTYPFFGGSDVGGLSSHGFMIFSFLDSLAIALYLLARAGWSVLPFRVKFAHAPVIFVATLLNFILVIVGALWTPTAASGWQVGAVLGLIAAIVAVAPIGVPLVKRTMGS